MRNGIDSGQTTAALFSLWMGAGSEAPRGAGGWSLHSTAALSALCASFLPRSLDRLPAPVPGKQLGGEGGGGPPRHQQALFPGRCHFCRLARLKTVIEVLALHLYFSHQRLSFELSISGLSEYLKVLKNIKCYKKSAYYHILTPDYETSSRQRLGHRSHQRGWAYGCGNINHYQGVINHMSWVVRGRA